MKVSEWEAFKNLAGIIIVLVGLYAIVYATAPTPRCQSDYQTCQQTAQDARQ